MAHILFCSHRASRGCLVAIFQSAQSRTMDYGLPQSIDMQVRLTGSSQLATDNRSIECFKFIE